jgi:flagellar hook-associated protein 1 FlgK
MPSISTILNVGYQALSAAQNQINVTANNLANASTEGYTRQRGVIEPNPPTYFSYGAMGSGVSLVNVERMRDIYADKTFRRETSGVGFADSRSLILGRVETVLNEPGQLGLSQALDNFLNSWSELATYPTERNVRNQVRQAGQQLGDTFQGITARLDLVRQEGEARLSEFVDRVNALNEEVSRLNREITSIEAGGISATELRDSRDRALDELAGLVDISVSDRPDGSVGVSLNGYSISDRDDFAQLEVRYTAGVAGIGIQGRTGLVGAVGGRVGGMVTGLNEDLADARSALDDLASALVTELNAVHGTGMSPNGATGIDFFDPAGTTASSIAISADLLADLDNLAAGTPDGLPQYRAGANDVALSIAAMRDDASAALGTSYSDSYRGLVSDVGLALRSSLDAGQVAQTLTDSATQRRESVGGVNTDEELVRLIRFQSAYQAAARVVTVADEMFQSLLTI